MSIRRYEEREYIDRKIYDDNSFLIPISTSVNATSSCDKETCVLCIRQRKRKYRLNSLEIVDIFSRNINIYKYA